MTTEQKVTSLEALKNKYMKDPDIIPEEGTDKEDLAEALATQQIRQRENNDRAFELLNKGGSGEIADPGGGSKEGGDSAMYRLTEFVQKPIEKNNDSSNTWGQPTKKHLEIMNRPLTIIDKKDADKIVLDDPPKNKGELHDREIKELKSFQELLENEDLRNKITLQDDSLMEPFKRYIRDNDLEVDSEELSKINKDLSTIVHKFKFFYNRPRPHQISDIEEFENVAGKSPSYPSGHSTNSTVIAELLADAFPEHADNFIQLGRQIGLNRVISGLHFPTDHIAGLKLAEQIIPLLIDKKITKSDEFMTELFKYMAHREELLKDMTQIGTQDILDGVRISKAEKIDPIADAWRKVEEGTKGGTAPSAAEIGDPQKAAAERKRNRDLKKTGYQLPFDPTKLKAPKKEAIEELSDEGFINADSLPEWLESIGYEPGDYEEDISRKAKKIDPLFIEDRLSPKAITVMFQKIQKDNEVGSLTRDQNRHYQQIKINIEKKPYSNEAKSALKSALDKLVQSTPFTVQGGPGLAGYTKTQKSSILGTIDRSIENELTTIPDNFYANKFIADNKNKALSLGKIPSISDTEQSSTESKSKQKKTKKSKKENITEAKWKKEMMKSFTENDLAYYLKSKTMKDMIAKQQKDFIADGQIDPKNPRNLKTGDPYSYTHPLQSTFNSLSDEQKNEIKKELGGSGSLTDNQLNKIMKPYGKPTITGKTPEDKPPPVKDLTDKYSSVIETILEETGYYDTDPEKFTHTDKEIEDVVKQLGEIETKEENFNSLNDLINSYNTLAGTTYDPSKIAITGRDKTPRAKEETVDQPDAEVVQEDAKTEEEIVDQPAAEEVQGAPEGKTGDKRDYDAELEEYQREKQETGGEDLKEEVDSDARVAELQAATKIQDAYNDLNTASESSDPVTPEDVENDDISRTEFIQSLKDYQAQGYDMSELANRLDLTETDLSDIQEGKGDAEGIEILSTLIPRLEPTGEVREDTPEEEVREDTPEEEVREDTPEEGETGDTKEVNLDNPPDDTINRTAGIDPGLYTIVDGWRENSNPNNKAVPDGLKHVLIEFPLSNGEKYGQWYSQSAKTGEWHPSDGFYQMDMEPFNRMQKDPKNRTKHRFNSMAANRHNLLQDADYDERTGELIKNTRVQGSEDTWNSPIHQLVRSKLKDPDSDFADTLMDLEQPFAQIGYSEHSGDEGAPQETRRFNERLQEGYDKAEIQRTIPDYYKQTEGDYGDNSTALSSDLLTNNLNLKTNQAKNAYIYDKIHENDKLALQSLIFIDRADLAEEWRPNMDATVKSNINLETGGIDIPEDDFNINNPTTEADDTTPVTPAGTPVTPAGTPVTPAGPPVTPAGPPVTPAGPPVPPAENLDGVINDNINIVSALHKKAHGDGPYDIERFKARLKSRYKTEDDLLHYISTEANKPSNKRFIDQQSQQPPSPPDSDKPVQPPEEPSEEPAKEIPVGNVDNIAREIINRVDDMPTLFNYNTKTKVIHTNQITNNESMMTRFRQLHTMFALEGTHISEGGRSPYVDEAGSPITRGAIEARIQEINPDIPRRVRTDLAGIGTYLPKSLQKKLLNEQGRPDYFDPSHKEELQQSRMQSTQQEQTHQQTLKEVKKQGVNHERFNSDLHRETQTLKVWDKAAKNQFHAEMNEKFKDQEGGPTKTQLEEERKARGLPPGDPKPRIIKDPKTNMEVQKGFYLWHAGTHSWVTPHYMEVHGASATGVPNGGVIDLTQVRDRDNLPAHILEGIHANQQGLMGLLHGKGKGAGVGNDFSRLALMSAKATRDENNKITHTDNIHGFTNDAHAAHMNVLGHYAEDQIANSTENKTTMIDSTRGVTAHPQSETSALDRYSARFQAAGGFKGALARFTAAVVPQSLGGGLSTEQAAKYSAPDFENE